MKTFILALLASFFFNLSYSQSYHPIIELAQCPIKSDARLVVKYGYLVVPENRKVPNGRKIKIPFYFARKPDQDARKNVFLYTTGGPGYSTIGNTDSIGYNSGLLNYGALLLFDQRGTKLSKPCLDCMEVGEAVKRSYKEGLNKDSLVLAAISQCRNRLSRQGIDLSAYNTVESAEDINDLRLALQLDSLALTGVSYSGGLMLTMARNHPEGVRLLMLNSPLPGFARYAEEGLLNINEALNQVFSNCEVDSADKATYSSLRQRFHQYFTGISGKKFTLNYLPEGAQDSTLITYTKNDLLSAIIDRLNSDQVQLVPEVINDIINGRHKNYVREVLNVNYSGDQAVSLGMRYSIFCAEQAAYSNRDRIRKQNEILPWLAGYSFDDVDQAVCNCWKVKPVSAINKTEVYSNIPALLVSGDVDPWCRNFYNQLIKRYFPNAQILIQHNKGHAPGYTADGVDYAKQFLAHPFKKLVSQSKNVLIE